MADSSRLHQKVEIERYRQGYPRLAAFLTADPDFTLLKRFDYLHMRTLLEQQDRLCELESQLGTLDDAEDIQLHLSSRRQDGNQGRRHLVQEIRSELEIYDKAVRRFRGMLALPQAHKKNRRSVRNWVDGNKPLVRSESLCFLEGLLEDDFIALGTNEPDKGGLEVLLDMILEAYPKIGNLVRSSDATKDPHIVQFSPVALRYIVKCTVVILVPLWLIVPAILLYNLSGGRTRTITYAVFTLGASFGMAYVATPTKYNLMMGVITYGAVLAAFLSQAPPP